MSNLVAAPTIAKNLETVLLRGDLSVLDAHDKIAYYKSVCESVGLNPLTKPFEYIKLNGKEVLYATRACTDQLRFIHKISLEIAARDKFDSLYVVTARARNPDGRVDESTGAVDLSNLKGDALANAMMKAETKANQIPVKMVIPIYVFLFPSIFVAIMGPVSIVAFEAISGIMNVKLGD